MSRISLSQEDVAEIKEEAAPGRSYKDRMSVSLALRMLHLSRTRQLDTHSVLDEIDYLEGYRVLSRTKKESQFCHPPLKPLWHKHFMTARHILKNIGVRWSLDRNGNRDLDRLIKKVAKEAGHDPDLWPNLLAHRLVVEGYEDRACSNSDYGLTGDWIVYGMHAGEKYYLDLSAHEEGQYPESLYRKLRNGCCAEFPFIFAEFE